MEGARTDKWKAPLPVNGCSGALVFRRESNPRPRVRALVL